MEQMKFDVEDLEDVIYQMEDSFQVRFEPEELQNHFTMEELANKIIAKMNLEEGDECSSQIVFFRLRRQLTEKLNVDRKDINLETRLDRLFPFAQRRTLWKKTFEAFELKLPELGPPALVTITFLLMFFLSGVILVFYHEYLSYALGMFLVAGLMMYIGGKYGTRLPAKDLRELTKQMVNKDYKSIREKYGTVHTKEVQTIVLEMLTDWMSYREKKNVTLKTKIDFK